MSSNSTALHRALQSLYENSSSFSVSVDIIQKLAKHLKLETFVDTDLPESAESVIKRLSIAGSLLLLEIDFSSDHDVVKVSLSSGHHNGTSPSNNTVHETPQVEVTSSVGTPQTVKIHIKESELASFISNAGSNGSSEAESILLSSLSSKTVGTFSDNLKYLANLDRMSPADGDLIICLNTIATYLSAISDFESKKLSLDAASESWTTRFGKVLLNDKESQRVGVLLQFWKHRRLMAESSTLIKAILSVEESGASPTDVLDDLASQKWTIPDSNGTPNEYVFELSEKFPSLNAALDSSKNWDWVLTLDEPVYLPQNSLDYLDIVPYSTCNDPLLDDVFSRSLQDGQVKFALGEDKKTVRIAFEENSPWVSVKAFPIRSMVQLSSVIPALRNFIVFTQLIRSILNSPECTICECNATELSAETSKKLKDSLKLDKDVPDNELLGLSTLGNDYMGVQMLNGGTNLGDFIKNEQTIDEAMEGEEESQNEKSTSPGDLVLIFKEILYGSPDSDVILDLNGEVAPAKSLHSQIKISNGVISKTSTDEGMDVDSDVSAKYVEALGICEDILLAAKAMED